MQVIGITGGVGAGKSFLLTHLKGKYNCKIVLADEVANALKAPGTKVYEALTELFAGQDVLSFDKTFDNAKMAALIFADESLLLSVNEIIHPAVYEWICEDIAYERDRGEYDFYILEAALLIECGYRSICDTVWYIYTSQENRRIRLKENRGYSDEKIDAIFSSQLSETEFRDNTDFVIDNNSFREAAIEQIDLAMNSTFLA